MLPIRTALLFFLAACSPLVLRAAEGEVRIDPGKVDQLKRLEPLTSAKVQIFVESGQLSESQAELVRRSIDRDGTLILPASNVGPEGRPVETRRAPEREAVAPPPPPAGSQTPLVRRADGSLDVMAFIQQDDAARRQPLPASERRRWEDLLQAYRGMGDGTRDDAKRDLRAAGAAVNPIVAGAYKDPIDLEIKVNLWKTVADHTNPTAAGYIAATHQDAVQTAHPVLIPYAKDVGGLIVRRKNGREEPRQLWISSRDLREMILELERAIAQCAGIRAVAYLSDVFHARYTEGDAPMRDSSRDQKRMVQACGGNKEDFDRGDPGTWHTSLPPLERALIAERLMHHLKSHNGDLRDIARDGLLVVLGRHADKKLKHKLEEAHENWDDFERWWGKRREELLGEN